MKRVVTHSSRFHADDVFAVATLSLIFNGEIEIVRSREKEVIDSGDIVVDVGSVYNPSKQRFDHHQSTFYEKRSNGIPYASFGLVWREYGEKLCGSQDVRDEIDKKLVQPIDAADNGVSTFETTFDGVYPYLVHSILLMYMPSWKEEKSIDEAFLESVKLAEKILSREIVRMQHALEARNLINDIYSASENKKIIVFRKEDKFGDEDIQHSLKDKKEVLFFVRYRDTDDNWSVKAMRDNDSGYENRKCFPSSWAGLSGEELAKVSGVNDAQFCHRGLFLTVAKSKEGAIKMAELAINQ